MRYIQRCILKDLKIMFDQVETYKKEIKILNNKLKEKGNEVEELKSIVNSFTSFDDCK
jgi:hypothetical protein